jgi:hypothetical protein
MARSSCRNWRNWIAPQRLRFQQDFVRTLVSYDRAEYITAVDTFVRHPNDATINDWYCIRDALEPLIRAGALHSILFWYHQTDRSFDDFPYILWDTCARAKTNLLDTLVLPIARAQKPKWCMRMFWNAFTRDRIGVLAWLLRHELVDSNDVQLFKYLMELEIEMATFHPSTIKALQQAAVSQEFWKGLVVALWRKEDTSLRFYSLISPPIVCHSSFDWYHDGWRHICGCKTRRKKLRRGSFIENKSK